MADWVSIKAEYCSTDISYRKLAVKHSVSFNTLKDRAIREGWKEQRNTTHNKIATTTQQKIVASLSDDAASYAASVARLSGKAMRLVEKSMDGMEEKADPYKVKAIVSALKDLRDIANQDERESTDSEDLTPLASMLGEPHE